LKVGRWSARLHPPWSDFASEGASLDRVRSRCPLQRAQRRGSRLLLGCVAGCGGAPLSFGLELRRDPLGRGLFGHRALSCESLGRGTLGRGTLGRVLRRRALSLRPLRFRAPLRGQPFRVCALCRGALRRRPLCGRAKFLFRASLLRGVTLLDRALHGGALLGGATVFLGASLLRQAPLFLRPPFVLSASLRGRALLFDPALGRSLLGRGSLCDGPLGRGALFCRALLFLSAPLHGGESFLDRALHRRVLGGGALFLFRSALLREASFPRGALGRGALLFRTTLRCRLLGRAAFCGGTLGSGSFLRRALLFLRASLLGRTSLPDRAFEGGVLGGGPLFLVGPTLLREASFLGGALGRSTILGRAALLELARFGGDSTLLRGAVGRRTLLRGDTLFFGVTRLLRRAPFFGDATIFGSTLLGRAKLRGDALLLGTARFLRDTFLFGALLGGVTLCLEASRFLDGALLFRGALGRDPLIFCGALCRDPLIFRGALARDALVICAPSIDGFVDGGEDLFVLEDREDLVIFDLTRLLGRGLFFERYVRERSLFELWRGGDRLVHRRPWLFDARLGLRRRVLERSRGRAAIFVDELLEQAAKRVGRRGAQIGWRRIARGVSTHWSDRAASLLSDVVLELVVFLAKPLDLFEKHSALLARLLEDLRGGGLGALADLVCGAKGARERLLGGGVVVLVDGDPALGGLEVGLELRDALGKLGHP
jgi:hypothetical protein